MTTTDADKAAYCGCMEQIKRRLRLIAMFTDGRLSTGDESADAEFACLQLRKTLEQVAYSALAASREHYVAVHPKIEREWRAKQILERLEELHPAFYPVPVSPVRLGPNRWHFDSVADGFLTKADFAFLYDKASSAIHEWNPFREGRRVIELDKPVSEWAKRIDRLLSYHYIRLLGQDDLLLIQFSDDTGKAHVLTASPQAG
jgi:hypothetical protein